ncbi:MAG: hypothetical protein A3F18_00190 [Legionellales bacterium RIFCSPHIGHO2_12_FULL_37_14]|nr:MAG: hypothetical protein A3F18_00190 [Legionellales bacterium RIFCSPHIGHO2_12_FULL_37_14]
MVDTVDLELEFLERSTVDNQIDNLIAMLKLHPEITRIRVYTNLNGLSNNMFVRSNRLCLLGCERNRRYALEKLKELARELPNHPNVTTFELYTMEADDELVETLSNNEALTSLGLRCCNLSKAAVLLLANNTRLKELDIGYNDEADAFIEQFSHHQRPRLEKLDLTNCYICDVESVRLLANMRLKSLYLNQNRISPDGFSYLQNAPFLGKVDLDFAPASGGYENVTLVDKKPTTQTSYFAPRYMLFTRSEPQKSPANN